MGSVNIVKYANRFCLLLLFSLIIVLSSGAVSATTDNETVNPTNSTEPIINEQITDQNKNTPIPHAAAGSVTFTQDEIKQASHEVKTHIENNKNLPDKVTINGIDVDMPSFLRLITSLTQKINNNDKTGITYVKCDKPTAPQDTITTGQLTKATYIEIAGIIQRYMDRNLKAPNYSTKTGLGAYWGYENMIYTYSKILDPTAQTTLPAKISILPWKYLSNYLGTFTIQQTKDAATRVKNYVETEKKLPGKVEISGIDLQGKPLTIEIEMPEFLQLLTTVIQKINKNDNTPTPLAKVYNKPAQSKDTITTGQLTKATYIEIAGIIQRYMDRNLKAPNYSTKTGLGTYWGYENIIYSYSKILNQSTLPAKISVTPWTHITKYLGTFTIQETKDAATRVKNYVETEKKLPGKVEISGIDLQGKPLTIEIEMPEFLQLLTTVIQKINKNDQSSTKLIDIFRPASQSKDQIHVGTISKSVYVDIAGKVQRYMDRNLQAPGYSSTTGLGPYLSYQNLIYTYSIILDSYKSALPATVAVKPWDKFSRDQVVRAAGTVKNYVDNNHKLPSYVTINGVQVGMPSFLLILTTTIYNIENGIDEAVYNNFCNPAKNSQDNQISGEIPKSVYFDIAGRVQRYMERNWVAPNYSSYSNLGRYLGYNNLVYTFSKVVIDSNNNLPSSVGVGPWWGSVTFLGSTSYGKVVKIGPFGNRDSATKIAYIIGVHPLESSPHKALLQSIKELDTSLKYCYYVYQVTVTKDAGNYAKGRMNGQLLAKYLVVPDILRKKYTLTVDVHNNVGNWAKTRFIFSPVSGTKAETIARTIKSKISWLSYFYPPNPTSLQYVTIPLIKGGVPAVVFEVYYYSPYATVYKEVKQLVGVVDSLSY
ncbi:MAG: pseudomurein-binding repeat-containing protein [Methanobacterium sp.]